MGTPINCHLYGKNDGTPMDLGVHCFQTKSYVASKTGCIAGWPTTMRMSPSS